MTEEKKQEIPPEISIDHGYTPTYTYEWKPIKMEYDDAYWIRVFAGQLVSSAVAISKGPALIVEEAYELLEEIKKREKEK